MKQCKACLKTKPKAEFTKDTSTKDGFKFRCRLCRAEEKALWRKRRKARTDPKAHDYGAKHVPPGFSLKGISQLIGPDGQIKNQWVKSVADKDNMSEVAMFAFEQMAKKFKGTILPKKFKKPKHNISKICTFVPWGDPHIGLQAWNEETGDRNTDLKEQRKTMFLAIRKLFDVAPMSDTCVIANLGDYFHSDNEHGTTTKGTKVDVDGRRVKVMRVGLEIFYDVIQVALTKSKNVHVICASGNHDSESSKMLAMMLDIMFSKEKRVSVEVQPRKFHKFRWGKCLLGVQHGDTGKDSDIPIVMATDWKEDWSECEYYHCYKGHVHHDSLKEYTGGVIVETFRTLAPSDRWHAAQGYRSGSDIKIDVWHKDYGKITRHTIGIGKILP